MPPTQVDISPTTPGAIFEFIGDPPAPEPLSSFSSYTDYVATLKESDGQYGWLHTFLSRPGPSPGVTEAFVIDRRSTGLKIWGARDMHGLSELLNRPSDHKSRVIIISYPESWSFDRQILEFLAMRYALNPLHLFKHLCHRNSWTDAFCPSVSWKFDLGWIADASPIVLPWENFTEFSLPFSEGALAAIRVQHQHEPEATAQQLQSANGKC